METKHLDVEPLKLKAVDFFCGAGGMTHGLLSAGIDVLAGIDKDSECQEIYEGNNRRPNGKTPVFLQEDTAYLRPWDLSSKLAIRQDDPSLVLAACCPCEFWSRVRKNRNSPQGGLLIEHFQRFVSYLRPGYVILENLPRLKVGSGRVELNDFKCLLENLGYEYDDGVVPLWSLGVPQIRDRYLLIAARQSETKLELPQGEIPVDGSFPESMALRHFIGEENGFRRLEAGERCPSDPTHRASCLSDLNLQRIRATPHDGGSRDAWSTDLELPRDTYMGTDGYYPDTYGRMSWDKPAPAISMRFNFYPTGRFGHPTEDRAISIREGATLQTFPRHYRFSEALVKAARQIGDGVPPVLARRLGKQVVDHWCHSSIRQNLAPNSIEVETNAPKSVLPSNPAERLETRPSPLATSETPQMPRPDPSADPLQDVRDLPNLSPLIKPEQSASTPLLRPSGQALVSLSVAVFLGAMVHRSWIKLVGTLSTSPLQVSRDA